MLPPHVTPADRPRHRVTDDPFITRVEAVCPLPDAAADSMRDWTDDKLLRLLDYATHYIREELAAGHLADDLAPIRGRRVAMQHEHLRRFGVLRVSA